MAIGRIKRSVRALLGRDGSGRDLNVLSDDIFLVSYPKSGNTWTRFLVGNLIHHRDVTFENIEEIVPDIYQHNSAVLSKVKRPRILKSHEYFEPRYKKVIYVVRDPRDVAVSYWHHQKKFRMISADLSIDQFVDLFVSGGLDPYGSWNENVGSWLGSRGSSSTFLIIRYEDLILAPEIEIKKIALFLGVKPTPALIEKAIRNSTFEKMQNLESRQYQKWKALKKTRIDLKFVRMGKTTVWKDELSVAAANKIEHAWHDTMSKLGYL